MKQKHLAANVLLAVLTTVLSLLLLEQAYRIYLFGVASFSFEKMNSVKEIGVSGLIKPSEFPEIIYELKPDLNTYFKLAKFKTNSNGLRDKEYPINKMNNVYRVAVIGDSFTMPAGVELEESFHSLLEEELNSGKFDLKYEVINFGVGGYNLRQYLAVIKLKAQKYSPDLIIVSFCPYNDHEIPRAEIFERTYKAKPERHPFYQSYVVDVFKRNILSAKKSKERINGEDIFSEEQVKYMSRMFQEIKVYSAQAKLPIIILYLTNKYDKGYAGELEKIVHNSGLDFADVSSPFEGIDASNYQIYLTDGHPNGEAHKIFADELLAYLIQAEGNSGRLIYTNMKRHTPALH